MALSNIRDSIREEATALVSSDFLPIVVETETVPSIDDPDITYPNLVMMQQQLKELESCILYVDLRSSTRISSEHFASTLADIYSSYIRAMTRCAHYYNGRVRNIIGDRVMVVFDRQDLSKTRLTQRS